MLRRRTTKKEKEKGKGKIGVVGSAAIAAGSVATSLVSVSTSKDTASDAHATVGHSPEVTGTSLSEIPPPEQDAVSEGQLARKENGH